MYKLIKTFEEFHYNFKNERQKYRYQEAFDTVNNAKIGDVLPNNTIYLYVEYLTILADKYDYSFVDGNLGDRLDEYSEYILQEIPISKLTLDEWDIDEESVEEYKNIYMRDKEYPPIVVDKDYTIIDGIHRANAIHSTGQTTILAFIGLK